MADNTIGGLQESPIGALPGIADLYDDSLLPVEQQGEARKMTGAQWKRYAQASVESYVDEVKVSSEAAAVRAGEAERAAENAAESAGEAAGSAQSAKEYAGKPPVIRDGTWWTWDAGRGEYVDTGKEARGETGKPGSNGVTPHIDETTKHWFVGDVDTGVLAEGVGGGGGYWLGWDFGPCAIYQDMDNINNYVVGNVYNTIGMMDSEPESIGIFILGNAHVVDKDGTRGTYVVMCKKDLYDEDFDAYRCHFISYSKILDAPVAGSNDPLTKGTFLCTQQNKAPTIGFPKYMPFSYYSGVAPTAGNIYRGLWTVRNTTDVYFIEFMVDEVTIDSSSTYIKIQKIISLTDIPFTPGDTLTTGADNVLNVKDPVNNIVTTEEYEALTEEQKQHGLWLIKDADELVPEEPDTVKFSWKGQIIDIPSVGGSGGSSSTSPNNSWVRYFTDTKPPQITDVLTLSKAAYPSLAAAKDNDYIFVLYGYSNVFEEDAEEEEVEGETEDSGEAEVASEDVGTDEGEEELPPVTEDETIVDVYDYWVCVARVTNTAADDVTVSFDTVFRLEKDSEDEAEGPTSNLWVVGNEQKLAITVDDPSLGMQTIGDVYLTNVSNGIFGLKRYIDDMDESISVSYPQLQEKFVGYLWMASSDTPETYRYFVSGTVMGMSVNDVDLPFGYPSYYNLIIDSGYLLESDSGDAPAPNDEPLTVETSEKDGWYIRKYSDGYVEMIGTFGRTIHTNSSYVGATISGTNTTILYMSPSYVFDYPFVLTKLYSEMVTVNPGINYICFVGSAIKSTSLNKTSSYYVITSSNVQMYVTFSVHVTGRWK